MAWKGDKRKHKKANIKGRRKKAMCGQDKSLDMCKKEKRRWKLRSAKKKK